VQEYAYTHNKNIFDVGLKYSLTNSSILELKVFIDLIRTVIPFSNNVKFGQD
jgi:hypothetical protein